MFLLADLDKGAGTEKPHGLQFGSAEVLCGVNHQLASLLGKRSTSLESFWSNRVKGFVGWKNLSRIGIPDKKYFSCSLNGFTWSFVKHLSRAGFHLCTTG